MKPKPQGKTKKMWLAVVELTSDYWFSDGLFCSRERAEKTAALRRPMQSRVIRVEVPVRKGR